MSASDNLSGSEPVRSKSTSPAGQVPSSPAAEAWIEETYNELRSLALSRLSDETRTVSLSPTVLVHEVYIRIKKQRESEFKSRSHFFAVASTMMRRILVDHARARARVKRGGQNVRVQLQDDLVVSNTRDSNVLAIDDALEELSALDPRQARIVEMRFFGGMNVNEVAESLELSVSTIEKEWQHCKAWLRKRLTENDR